MKIKKIILSAIITFLCCSMTACGTTYQFKYEDDSYTVTSWGELSIAGDIERELVKELSRKTITFDGRKLIGLFGNDIELEVTDRNENGKIEEAVFNGDKFDFADLVETYGKQYQTEDTNAYFVPYHIECEIKDQVLWIEAMVCPNEVDSWTDDDLISYVEFSYALENYE